jgi:trimeric autotransporter adhesin
MKKFILLLTLLFIVHCTLYIQNCKSQNWFPLGSGTSGEVMALTEYNNELIVGGNFTTAGGINVNRLAKWNGTNWSAFGTAYPGIYVTNLLKFGNDLIVSGCTAFNNDYIQKWNGSSWSILGGSNGYCGNCLIVYNNQLIAGGVKVTQGGDTVNYIVRWNGTNWLPLGSGVNGNNTFPQVKAMVVYNNELIVGGHFNTAGGVNAQCIAKWNGTSWSALGTGIKYNVYSLIVYNNQLIAGGDFDTAGGVVAHKTARWNGTSWSSLGSGMTGSIPMVRAFIILNNELIAGGTFSSAGEVSASNIAKWNGTNWSALSSGISGNSFPNVEALALFNNNLFAGGLFYGAGTYLANNIAKWGTSIGIKKISENIPEKFTLEQNYPNPFNPTTNIKYRVPSGSIADNKFVLLKIFNILGKEVETLVNEKQTPGTFEVNWNAENYPSGVYYYTLSSGDFKETMRMLLVK